MAVAIRGTGAATSGTTTTSVTINKPTGTVDDDVMYAVVVNGGANAAPSTVPTGWTLVQSAGGTNRWGGVYRRVASSEGASYTWSGFTDSCTGCAIAFSGADTAAPENASTVRANTSPANGTASITTTVDGCYIVGFAALDDNLSLTAWACVTAGAMTEALEQKSTGGGDTGSGIATVLQTTAAATGAFSYTPDFGVHNTGVLIAVAPASGGGAISPTGPTVTITAGTPALARSIAPTGPTVSVTPGTPSLKLAIAPVGPTVTITPGTPALALAIAPTGATVAVTAGTPALARAITPTGPTVTLTPGTPTIEADLAADPPNLAVDIVGTTAELTWDASPTPDVEDYSIFRRTPQTGAPFDPDGDTPIASGVTDLFYDDTGLGAGPYDWQVFGRVAEAWSPLDLGAKLEIWSDPSDAGTVTGDPCSQLADKSGHGYHWLASGAAQPDTGAATINGRNVLTLDGSNHYMEVALSGVTIAGFYFVVENHTLPGGSRVYIGHDYGSIYRESGGELRHYSNGDLASGESISEDVPFLCSSLIAGGSSFIRKDGAGASGTLTGTTPAKLTMGANNDFSAKGAINMGEFVAVNAALTAPEEAALGAYLQGGWATP